MSKQAKEVEFISTYKQPTYKIPDTDKYARFNAGRLVTRDEEVISYLRQHQDYGNTLTEVTKPSRSIPVDVIICPVCKRVFKTQGQYEAHFKSSPVCDIREYPVEAASPTDVEEDNHAEEDTD